jgi:MoaA/NifB/PqqE/SkfB family radical SAM enzyme
VDAIGIPVEGSTRKIHDSIRGSGSFENVKRALDTACDNSKKIYISTVVTPKNILDIGNIEKFLIKYKKKIIYWKLYEFIKYNDRPFQAIGRAIQPALIKLTIDSVGKKLGGRKTFYLTSRDRSEASFIINPNGDAIVPRKRGLKTSDLILGNILFGDIREIFKKWSSLIDYNKYRCHNCALKNGCIVKIK